MNRCPTCGRLLHRRGFALDTAYNVLIADRRAISLTPRQTDYLSVLLDKIGQPVSRERLFIRVYGYDGHESTRTQDVIVAQIRKLLKGTRLEIQTIRGDGWRLVAKEAQ